MKLHPLLFFLTGLLWAAGALPAAQTPSPSVRAAASSDRFALQLAAQAGPEERVSHGDAGAGRPMLASHAGTRLRIRWSVVNRQKSGTVADVTVHFVLLSDSKDAMYESALVMDFAPQRRSSADFFIEAPAPGNYVLRLETIGAAKARGHEQSAAIDLRVSA